METEVPTKEPVKSWARELSVALIIGLGVMIYADKTEMVELTIWPVTMFAVGAFMPNKLQQIKSLRPPQ